MKTGSIKSKALKVIFIIAAVLYGTLLSQMLAAQAGTMSKEKMAPFENWAGKWEGEGWSIDASRQRTEFTVTEHIQKKIDGYGYLAEGLGKNKETGAVGFMSLGVFYYNNEKETYEVRSWLADGNTALSKAELKGDGHLVWGFEVPGGKVRYTIKFDSENWHEKGEFVMEGGQAFPIMEMRLKKVQ